MALLLGATLDNDDLHKMGARGGKSAGRSTMRKLVTWKAPPRFPPSPPITGGTIVPQADINRNFQRVIATAWRTVLSPSQRAAWGATAASNPVMQNDHTIKTLTGMQLYNWYHSTNYWWYINIGTAYFIDPTYLLTDPPDFSTKPPTPTGATFHTTGPGFVNIEFNWPDTYSGDNASALCHPYSTGIPRFKQTSLVRMAPGWATLPPTPNLWTMTCFIGAVLRTIADLTGNTIQFRMMSDYPDLIPSDPVDVALP